MRNGLYAVAGTAITSSISTFDYGSGSMAPAALIKSGIELTPYVDPLSVPPVIDASLRENLVIDIQMRQFHQKLHRDLPPTMLWGFNGSWPGPTIEARPGRQVTIRWSNHLPSTHFLPIDHTLHGAEETLPQVRTITHVHGASVPSGSDGYPDAWYTADGQHGPRFNSQPFTYPNHQRPRLSGTTIIVTALPGLIITPVFRAFISFATMQSRR